MARGKYMTYASAPSAPPARQPRSRLARPHRARLVTRILSARGRRAVAVVATAALVVPLTVLAPHTVASATSVGANPANCPGGVLGPHAEITISSDADFTAANGVTGGSGTTADPYVISCWSITVPNSTKGISVSGTVTKAFPIHDVGASRPGP